MQDEVFLRHMHDELGLSHRKARRVLETLASGLFRPLPAPLRARMAEESPIVAAALAPDEPARAPVPLPRWTLVERVREAMGGQPGPALETTQVACRLLGEELDPDTQRQLLRHLAADVAELFEARELPEPPVVPHPHSHYQGVADGRTGSSRSLAEARPLEHADSVAATPDPHGESKLSSGSGISTEREGSTLAAGRPGSRHPLADGEE